LIESSNSCGEPIQNPIRTSLKSDRKKKRLFDDPEPENDPKSKVEEDYPELPKANSIVALPADALKDAGSGMSNSSLSHMQQWLAGMKKQGEDQLKDAQKNYTFKADCVGAALVAPNRSFRNKKLDGVRFLRTFEGDRVPGQKNKFHTSIPFNYNQRGGGRGAFGGRGGSHDGGDFHSRGGGYQRGVADFRRGRGGPTRGRGDYQNTGRDGNNLRDAQRDYVYNPDANSSRQDFSNAQNQPPYGHSNNGGHHCQQYDRPADPPTPEQPVLLGEFKPNDVEAQTRNAKNEYQKLLEGVERHKEDVRQREENDPFQQELRRERDRHKEKDRRRRDRDRRRSRSTSRERNYERSRPRKDNERDRRGDERDHRSYDRGGYDRGNDRGRYAREDRGNNRRRRSRSRTPPRSSQTDYSHDNSRVRLERTYDDDSGYGARVSGGGPNLRREFDEPYGNRQSTFRERGRGGYERGRGSYDRGRGGYERGRGGRGAYDRGRGRGRGDFDRGGYRGRGRGGPPPMPVRTADYADPHQGEYLVCGESMFQRGMYGSIHLEAETPNFMFDEC